METTEVRNYSLQKVALFDYPKLREPSRDCIFLQFFVAAEIREVERIMNKSVLNATKQQGQSANLNQKVVISTEDRGNGPIGIVLHSSVFHNGTHLRFGSTSPLLARSRRRAMAALT